MNTEYVIAAIECLIDAKVNGTSQGVKQAQKELRKALDTPPSWMANEADLAPCAAKLKVDFEEDLPKTRYVTFLYDKGGDSALARLASPTRRMIQVDKDEYGVISGIDVDKDEYRRFSKRKIIGNIEEIV
jgi:hypothetical protein